MTPKLHHKNKRRGFLLLEVLLAMMVFSLAATGIVLALSNAAKLTYDIERDQWVRKHQERILTEVLTSPSTLEEFLEEKVFTLDEFAAEATVTVAETELESSNGTILKNLYDIEIRIKWFEDDEEEESVMRTLHHFPLYQY